MKLSRLKSLGTLPERFLERESSFLGKQQLYVFVYYTAVIVVGLLTNLVGLSGPQRDFNFWLNLGYIFVILLLFLGYIRHKLPLSGTLFGIIMVTQVSTSVEMVNCALAPDEYHLMLIVGNMVILAVNILFSLLAYLKYVPYILCTLSIAVYLVCIAITGNDSLGNFAGVFFAIFIVVCILGNKLVKNMRFLDNENSTLKKDEEELFGMLGQDKEQVMAYAELAQKNHEPGKTDALLELLGEDLQRNVITNVKEHISRKETEMLEMKELFPELTASEREICLLVLQDRKLNDICKILDKTESTVTSTRAHIRKKLDMKPSDNLRKVLLERVKLFSTQKHDNTGQ